MKPTFVLSDGEADVLGRDSVVLQHLRDDPGLLEHLGGEILQDGGQVDWSEFSHSKVARVVKI